MTLDYYNKNALAYSQETQTAKFQDRRIMLLKYLEPPAYILDLGCGAGRDSKAFIDQGYQVKAIDGSEELCKIASHYINQEVVCQRFQDLNESNAYDGVWACASLLHVPSTNLPEIFGKISKALKLGGYFYGSFKHGTFEGERNGRYFTDLTKEKLKVLIELLADLELIETEITNDVRPNRENEQWLNFIITRRRI